MKYIFVLLTLLTFTGYGQTLTNNTTVVVEPGTLMSVNGNVVNNSSASFFIKGQMNISGNIINHDANFGFSASTGKVLLNGTSQIIGGSFASRFAVLELSGGIKTLEQPISVGHNTSGTGARLLLNNSILKLNSQSLTIRAATTLAIERTTGFVESETNSTQGLGSIQWEISNAAASNAFVFPFGNSTTNSYLPVTLTLKEAAAANAFLIAATYATDATTRINNRPLPNGVAEFKNAADHEMAPQALDRFWVIDRQNMDVAAKVEAAFSYRDTEWDGTNNSTNVISEPGLKPVFWNSGAWDVSNGTVDPLTNTITMSDLLLAKGTVGAYQNAVYMPLPLKLIGFNASCKNNGVSLQWITANEAATKNFIIQNSADGIAWQPAGTVAAKGNTTQELYSLQLATGTGKLYKLKIEDVDGSFTYSPIRKLDCELMSSISVGPNPTSGEVAITMHAAKKDNVTVMIMDVKGSIVLKKSFVVNEGFNVQKVNLSAGADGTFFIKLISTGGINTTHRIIKM